MNELTSIWKKCCEFFSTGDKFTKICGSKSVGCCKDAENRLFGEDVIDGLGDKDAKIFRKQCDCLPGCRTIQYEVEIDRAKLDLDDWLRAYNAPDDKIPKNQRWGIRSNYLSILSFPFNIIRIPLIFGISEFSRAFRTRDESISHYELFYFARITKLRLIIAFGDYLVTTLKKSASCTPTDFLAACGGLLGLFLGLSALNIMQFVYRLALRAFCVLRQLNTRNKVTPFHRNIAIYNSTFHSVDSRNTDVA